MRSCLAGRLYSKCAVYLAMPALVRDTCGTFIAHRVAVQVCGMGWSGCSTAVAPSLISQRSGLILPESSIVQCIYARCAFSQPPPHTNGAAHISDPGVIFEFRYSAIAALHFDGIYAAHGFDPWAAADPISFSPALHLDDISIALSTVRTRFERCRCRSRLNSGHRVTQNASRPADSRSNR